ncbi:XdhC family protein [Flavobacterium sp. LC2016-01]|uniref:XdhC family protein n=1 Tax=Flavobacterium sp. LC2016-01 TaxID=2675876 RepID=UPI0012BA97D2|nr:XdhC family protein [Flavobacterium sp. LC2016-01]MTH17742.1 hypothetical protein [Flavobacterium sp. LC2016-01]
MLDELLKLKEAYRSSQAKGIKAVMATVVAVEGSSYRQPGLRMLVFEDATIAGAVNQGPVEDEILRQCQSVLLSDKAKIMVYEGRYRQGSDGLLYILLEPFLPDDCAWNTFEAATRGRLPLQIESFYKKIAGTRPGLGSLFHIGDQSFGFSSTELDKSLTSYTQLLKPVFV